ncbi:MAG: hypothetical protein WCK65_14725, partial [Rhodospirillaceae bacterium]
ELVQNVRKLIMPSEMVLSQCGTSLFLAPLNNTWIDDNGNPVYRRDNQYAIVIDVTGLPTTNDNQPASLPFANAAGSRFDLTKGYATVELKKMAAFKGTPSIKWLGQSQNGFDFLGAYWDSTQHRKYAPGKKDIVNDCFRGLSEASVGTDYVMAAVIQGTREISRDINFDRARKDFKRWKDLSFMNGLKKETEVLMFVEDGVVGIWFPPIKSAKQPATGEPVYAFDGALVKVGTTSDRRLRGKWCVPERKIERIWNFVSNPWTLLVPNLLETIELGQDEARQRCLSFEQAQQVMDTNVCRTEPGDNLLNQRELTDKGYQRLRNLGSDQEGDPGWVEIDGVYRRGNHGEVGQRLFLPLIMKCGRMWVHFPSIG